MLQTFVSLSVNGVLSACFLALGAIGLTLTFGVLRFANIAHADFMMIGAYSALVINLAGVPVPLAVLLGIAAAAVIGTTVASVTFDRLRISGIVSYLVVSIGLSMMLRYTVQLIFGPNFLRFDIPMQRPHNFGLFRLTNSQLLTLGVTLAVIVALYVVMMHTRFGRHLRALADNATLCELSGIDTARTRLGAWMLISGVTAIGGVLFGLNFAIHPNMGWNMLIPVFSATILGGIGSVPGALVGALVIGLAQEWSTLILPSIYKEVVSFAVLAACLLVRPQGLWGRR